LLFVLTPGQPSATSIAAESHNPTSGQVPDSGRNEFDFIMLVMAWEGLTLTGTPVASGNGQTRFSKITLTEKQQE
jgi:hypothetical protein